MRVLDTVSSYTAISPALREAGHETFIYFAPPQLRSLWLRFFS
jgi:hypothetical protein